MTLWYDFVASILHQYKLSRLFIGECCTLTFVCMASSIRSIENVFGFRLSRLIDREGIMEGSTAQEIVLSSFSVKEDYEPRQL